MFPKENYNRANFSFSDNLLKLVQYIICAMVPIRSLHCLTNIFPYIFSDT